MIVKISSAIAALERAKPGRSIRRASGSREVGTVEATSAIATAATGAIAKKMLLQENRSSSQPPTIGPSAIATPAVAPQSPIAERPLPALGEHVRDQRQGGREDGAAPRPIKQRAAIRPLAEVAKPPARLAAPNDGQAGEQHSLSAEAVAEAARRQEQGGEDEVVGVDDPLQLAVRGMQLADERRQGDVRRSSCRD